MANSRLDEAYASQVKAVRGRVETFARSRFMAGQFHDADLERFVAQVVPVVLAGRRQVSALTDAWLAVTLTDTLGRRVRPLGTFDTDSLRGVEPAAVYARPYVTVRTKLAEGKALDAAVGAGLARVSDLVLADMQLAKTHTAQSVLSRTKGVTAFMRTLTGNVNCALCYVASTQRYHKEDLLPIHPGCDCGVVPIADTGEQVINEPRLAATHEAVEDRLGESDSAGRAPDYRKQLIVREHGELGPVLAVRGHHFQGRSVLDN